MSTDVVMPQMGESIFEGTITRWLKKVGEQVEKDEPLFEISTDKVDAEIPAPVAGLLSEILTDAGATVTINTVVARIGGVVGETAVGAAVKSDAAVAAPAVEAPKRELAPARVEVVQAQVVSEEPRSSPLVRKIARENNVDLRYVKGTGLGERVNKDDILSYIANTDGQRPARQDSLRDLQSGSQRRAVAKPDAPFSTLPGTVAPLSKMRTIIAQRMVESLAVSPHVHSVFKIDMTRVVQMRQRARAICEQKHGVKLTYMPFIAAAAIDALRRYPVVNSSLVGNEIHYHANVNLGIAVSLEWGLIVPVVRAAETLDFIGLARAIADLAERARTKKLKPDEASGSTFTLTNSGIFGDEFGTPIINQPESAILAIGALKKEPVVLTDDEGTDSIAIRTVQNFCLGFDHRTIDGADSGKFMSQFKKNLENWDQVIG
jgi:pyruvate dehydrogenase E2 component (dihydrolipoamide acetyltransferase)